MIQHREREHVHEHGFSWVESSLNNAYGKLRLFFPKHVNTVIEGVIYAYDRLLELIQTLHLTYKTMKLVVFLRVEMFRYDEFGQILENIMPYFRSKQLMFTRGSEERYEDMIQAALQFIDDGIAAFVSQGSGWVAERPIAIEVEVARCKLLTGNNSATECNLHLMTYKKAEGGVLPLYNGPVGDSGFCFYLAVAAGLLREERQSSIAKVSKTTLIHYLKSKLNMEEEETFERHGVLAASQDISAFEAKLEEHLQRTVGITVIYSDEDGVLMPYRALRRTVQTNIVLVLFHTARSDNSVVYNQDLHLNMLEENEVKS